MGEHRSNLDEVLMGIESNRPRGVPADYTIQLNSNMRDFFEDFLREYDYQSTKVNKASERRMRVLLREFYERVYTPYREATRQSNRTVGNKDAEEADD